MLIVDSQVHIWAEDTRERPWAGGGFTGGHREEPLGKNELLQQMEKAGVDRVLIVPPSFEGDYNDLALEAAGAHPDRFRVMGRLPIDKPSSRQLVARWRDQPGMLGVRLTLHLPGQQDWLVNGTTDWFWDAAEEAQIPVMVFAPGQLPAIGDVAKRHPELRLVIDHLGLGLGVRDDAIGQALEALWPLARYSNVAVKASALPAYVTEEYPFPLLQKHIFRSIDTFGAERVFWGTDFTRLPCSYRQAVTHFTDELGLDDADKRLVMGEGVVRWLNWSEPTTERPEGRTAW